MALMRHGLKNSRCYIATGHGPEMDVYSVTKTEQHGAKALDAQRGANLLFWLLLGIYIFARFLQVYPGRVQMLAIVALHVFPPALFAIIHGTRIYRIRGILVFIGIALAVANFYDALSLRTGFSFGHYYFTSLMGPKLGSVPVLLGLAYVGMAYLVVDNSPDYWGCGKPA
jgi:uncharacterized membrane protein